MKNILCLAVALTGYCLLPTAYLYSQAPQSFNYQAVARDNIGNQLATGTAVDLQFTIHDGSASGTAVYQETFTSVTTTLGGLFAVAVGSGTPVTGTFNSISWTTAKYLQVQFKLHSAATYIDMGTSQLLSVPYSLVAQTAINSSQWTTTGNDIYNANSGNVGIGTSAPIAKVDVRDTSGGIGMIVVETGSSSAGTAIHGDCDAGHGVWASSDMGRALYATANSGTAVDASTNSGTAGHFYSTSGYGLIVERGDVGIGTGAPIAKVDVRDASGGIGMIVVETGSSSAGTAIHGDCNAGHGVWASSDMGRALYATANSGTAVDASTNSGTAGHFYSTSGYGLIVERGNVGIGIGAPTAKLDIADANGAGIRVNETNIGGAAIYGYGTGTGIQGSSGTGHGIEGISNSNGTAGYFFSANGTAGYFKSDNSYGLLVEKGYVGIGTLTPVEQLEVNGAIKIGNTTAVNIGTIRFTPAGNLFQGFDGTAWVNFGAGAINPEVLSLDNQTKILSLSNGGGTADLSTINTDGQTLAYNSGTGALSISGGNSVMLAGSTNYWTPTGNTIANNNTSTVNIGTALQVTSVQSSAATFSNSAANSQAITATETGNSSGVAVNASSACATCAAVKGSSTLGYAGYFSSTSSGTAGYFYSTLGYALIAIGGNVGINTAAPTHQLEVAGTGYFTGSLKIGAYTLPTVDGTANQVLSTNGAGVVSWATASGGGGSGWSLTGNAGINSLTNFLGTTDNKPVIIKQFGNEALRVETGGALLATGTASGVTPVTGAGVRMMWIPAKGAFRAGTASGAEWDDANIGNSSIALGSGVTANGASAIAIGSGEANGQTSGMFGSANHSYETNTYTFGYSNTAGIQNGNAAAGGMAIGSFNTVYGSTAFAFGDNNFARMQNSMALGIYADAKAVNSFAIGNSCIAYSDNSFAIGTLTGANGANSMAIGNNLHAYSAFEIALGQYATSYTPNSTTNWDPADRLLVVGNGSSFATSANALIIYKNGNVTIGGSNPVEKLEVCGNIKASGTITASQSISCSSDVRFKKNISPLTGALDNVSKLRGVTYNWKQDEFPERNFNTDLQIGVIAQEVEAVYPQLVVTGKDGYKSVDYSRLTPILLEAIKELKTENNDLKTRVGKIEKMLSA